MWSPPVLRCPNDGDGDDGTEPTRNTADGGDDGGAGDGSRWSPRCYCCWQRCRCSDGDGDDGGDRDGDDYC